MTDQTQTAHIAAAYREIAQVLLAVANATDPVVVEAANHLLRLDVGTEMARRDRPEAAPPFPWLDSDAPYESYVRSTADEVEQKLIDAEADGNFR